MSESEDLAAWVEEQLAHAPEPSPETLRRLSVILWPEPSTSAD